MAGVSINTVSRALRAPQTVRPQLRSRIEAVMNEINYVPNRLAGGLAGTEKTVVGVVLTSLLYSEFAAIIDAMQAELSAAGLRVMLANSNYDPEEELRAIRSMLSWRPAALALVGVDHDPRARLLIESTGIPVVEFWDLSLQAIDSVVGMDHRQIGRQQTEHLFDRGYRRPAFVGGVRRHDYRAQRRLEGYIETCAAHGRNPLTAIVPTGGYPDLGENLALNLVERNPELDGIVCNSDVIAMGALRGLARRGIAVPHRIGLIGFGNSEAASCLTPTLSTIRPPRAEIGAAVAQMLLARIGGESPGRREFTAELMPRQSSAGRG